MSSPIRIHRLTPASPGAAEFSIWNALEPPAELYVQGRDGALALLGRLPARGLGVVGTRFPQQRSLNHLRHAISGLAGQDLVVVSGFARGIDAAAHRAALDHGLPTVGVLGAGLDVPYPRENEGLRHAILEAGGVLISEFPPGTRANPGNFLQRNRLIAAWSLAVWVVEAADRSGALNTARWARDHHRICLATPGYPGDPSLAGNQKLLDEGHAFAFWNSGSLGVAWLELAGLPGRAKLALPEQGELPFHVRQLVKHVSSLTSERGGGAPVQDLLDWAIQHDWPPQKFFDVLQKAVQGGLLFDQNGLLLKNPAGSD